MVWWAYSSSNKYHGAKGRGFESPRLLFFFRNVPRANSSEEMRLGTGGPSPREERRMKTGAATRHLESGYEKNAARNKTS